MWEGITDVVACHIAKSMLLKNLGSSTCCDFFFIISFFFIRTVSRLWWGASALLKISFLHFCFIKVKVGCDEKVQERQRGEDL